MLYQLNYLFYVLIIFFIKGTYMRGSKLFSDC